MCDISKSLLWALCLKRVKPGLLTGKKQLKGKFILFLYSLFLLKIREKKIQKKKKIKKRKEKIKKK